MNQIDEIKKGMDSEQRKMIDEILETFRDILHNNIVQAISELQILEAQLAEKDFVLGVPDKYTEFQRHFMGRYVRGFAEALREEMQREVAE